MRKINLYLGLSLVAIGSLLLMLEYRDQCSELNQQHSQNQSP